MAGKSSKGPFTNGEEEAMARNSKKMSGAEFIKNLSEMGEPPVIMTGMVKLSNGDNNSLLFARPGNCSHWVPVPADMIDHVETVGAVGCQGHAHHLVQLHLKRPESRDAQTLQAWPSFMLRRSPSRCLRLVAPTGPYVLTGSRRIGILAMRYGRAAHSGVEFTARQWCTRYEVLRGRTMPSLGPR